MFVSDVIVVVVVVAAVAAVIVGVWLCVYNGLQCLLNVLLHCFMCLCVCVCCCNGCLAVATNVKSLMYNFIRKQPQR